MRTDGIVHTIAVVFKPHTTDYTTCRVNDRDVRCEMIYIYICEQQQSVETNKMVHCSEMHAVIIIPAQYTVTIAIDVLFILSSWSCLRYKIIGLAYR
jgi:hypothetical protein